MEGGTSQFQMVLDVTQAPKKILVCQWEPRLSVMQAILIYGVHRSIYTQWFYTVYWQLKQIKQKIKTVTKKDCKNKLLKLGDHYRYLEDGYVPGEALHSLGQLPALQALLHRHVMEVLMELHRWGERGQGTRVLHSVFTHICPRAQH